MMRAHVLVAVAILLLTAAAARADVLRVSASNAVVSPADGSGITKVVLEFDVSGMREGANRRIEEATLDWQLPAMQSETRYSFKCFAATESWTETGVGENGSPTREADPRAEWDFEAADYERIGEGLIRFYVRDLINEWESGSTPNHGLVIELPGISRAGLSGELEGAVLTVRYGFR